jgi:dihydroflavonol-4-reductase
MKFLVTGASGFVGGHVARRLVRDGHHVRALLRPTSNRAAIEDLALETITGDLSSAAVLEQAMSGVDGVFHVAAVYSFDPRDRRAMHEGNVEGTRRVLAAALVRGVPRVVCTSSMVTLSAAHRAPDSVYAATKLEAERLALEAARSGQDVVIVNPSGVIGAADHKPTPTGRLIVDYLNGKLPGYVAGGFNAVGTDDVAAGHWLAFEKGKTGERYALTGEDVTVKGVLDQLSDITGLPPVRLRIPFPVAFAVAAVAETACRLTGRPAPLSREYVRAGKTKPAPPSALPCPPGYAPRPIADSLREAVAWYRANGYARA